MRPEGRIHAAAQPPVSRASSRFGPHSEQPPPGSGKRPKGTLVDSSNTSRGAELPPLHHARSEQQSWGAARSCPTEMTVTPRSVTWASGQMAATPQSGVQREGGGDAWGLGRARVCSEAAVPEDTGQRAGPAACCWSRSTQSGEGHGGDKGRAETATGPIASRAARPLP